jgi:hypothetical protein
MNDDNNKLNNTFTGSVLRNIRSSLRPDGNLTNNLIEFSHEASIISFSNFFFNSALRFIIS